jgi:transposase-like protein
MHMASKSDTTAQREQILVLALGGQSPQALAKQFGVTERSIRRWVGLARRHGPRDPRPIENSPSPASQAPEELA